MHPCGRLYFAALIAFSVRNYYCIFITPDYLVTTIFLIPVCLAYFYELLTTANPRPLRDRPGFWVITGAFLVNGGTIPLMLSANYLGGYYNIAYSLNYILFGILFFLLTRAYFCPADEPELKE